MKKILVVGDIILDKYVFVRTERQCPEAEKPVWDTVRTDYRLGGAANLANNLSRLGDDVQACLAGLANTFAFTKIEDTTCINTSQITIVDDHEQVVKTRIVEDNGLPLRDALVARIDDKKSWGSDNEQRIERDILRIDRNQYDAIVISDYRMGTISDKAAKYLCENPPCKVFVDSKRKDLSVFRGAYVLKLNDLEHSLQVSNRDYIVESIAQFTVVTKGGDGARVIFYEPVQVKNERPCYITRSIVFPVEQVKVVDVTGCGDTFTAALAYYIITKSDDIYTATRFANVCASKVVQKLGTSI